MTSPQQDEALSFFNRTAGDWNAKSMGRAEKVNVIAQRNGVVLEVLAEKPADCHLLDVGCGTGQLVIAAAEQGRRATGIDFAPEMIDACRVNLRAAQPRAPADFTVASVFEYVAPERAFDVVSGLGLIEYISVDQLDLLCDRMRALLRPGGVLILGSRNRLFNVVSLNGFTGMERELGTLDALSREAEAIGLAGSPAEGLRAAEAAAARHRQPSAHPATTGIEVSLRYQYTPGELAGVLRGHGFAPARLWGVHYHAFPPAVAKEWLALHRSAADAAYAERREDHRLVPFCSSFVLAAVR